MQIFIRSSSGYVARPLVEPLAISVAGAVVAWAEGAQGDAVAAWIVPQRQSDGQKLAALLSNSEATRVNGQPPLPLAVLQRGDAIGVGPATVYFTDEDPLVVVPFAPPAGAAEPTLCGRCSRPIAPGDPVVFCPTCSLPFMAQADRAPNCWSAGPCLGCQRDPHVEVLWQPGNEPLPVPWPQRAARRAAAVLAQAGSAAAGA